jgi:Arc/MetJ family transcription regulator
MSCGVEPFVDRCAAEIAALDRGPAVAAFRGRAEQAASSAAAEAVAGTLDEATAWLPAWLPAWLRGAMPAGGRPATLPLSKPRLEAGDVADVREAVRAAVRRELHAPTVALREGRKVNEPAIVESAKRAAVDAALKTCLKICAEERNQ